MKDAQEVKPEVIQEVTQDQAQPTQEAAAVDLNLNDLAMLRNIVDLASQRGSFKANELEAVGKVYNKLSLFLETVTKKEPA